MRRFRRSTGIERLQLRLLVTTASFVAILYTIALLISFAGSWGVNQPTWMTILQNISVFSFGLIPIAIGVSVLRYHLFDIDVVINRALLYGTIAVVITAVYVGIVVGIGTLVGSQGEPILAAAAAAIIAIAFQPLRTRAQRFADRLVYGERAAPYEVLSEFSERLGNTYANDQLLPRMAAALAGGTGAVRADVWVRIGDQLVPEATWPHDAETLRPIPADGNDAGEVSPSEMREPIRHQGELLGALSIVKRPGDSISPPEEKFVRDLAAQAGLVMRNVALTEQLMDNVEQLRASRQRLVHAQDEERRKLERNLHDGAQQQLVALSVQLRLAEGLVDRDPEKTKSMLANLQTATGQAIEDLRDLARGIYPPLLADKGLVAALEAQARKGTIATTVEAENVERYPQQVEAAVYFCALEALNNVAKYSGAQRAQVRLAQSNGDLTFEVSDEGAGFDMERTTYGTGLRGMADRVEAIGGMLEIRSTPGRGTSVAGRIPTSTLPRLRPPLRMGEPTEEVRMDDRGQGSAAAIEFPSDANVTRVVRRAREGPRCPSHRLGGRLRRRRRQLLDPERRGGPGARERQRDDPQRRVRPVGGQRRRVDRERWFAGGRRVGRSDDRAARVRGSGGLAERHRRGRRPCLGELAAGAGGRSRRGHRGRAAVSLRPSQLAVCHHDRVARHAR